MSGGGAGDRLGLVPSRAAGDRPVRLCARPVSLIGLDGALVAIATLVVDDWIPDVVMFDGEPYLLVPSSAGLAYRKARVYRADMVSEAFKR